MIEPIDPYAQVIVKVKLKNVRSELPGIGLELVDESSVGITSEVSMEDVESLDIQITSRLDPFPNKLKDSIIYLTKFENVETKVDYVAMDSETEKMIQSNRLLESINRSIIYLLIGGTLLVLLLLFLMRRWSKNTLKTYEDYLNRLVEAVNGGSQKPILDISNETEQDQKSMDGPMKQLGAEDTTLIRSMTVEPLKSLISDCYWCEFDSYAKYIWNTITNEQRVNLIKNWKMTEDYIKSLSKIQEENMGFHNHPSFLNPVKIYDVSQDDLSAALRKNPSLWHRISPMRQSTATLSLEEKLSCISSTPTKTMGALPKASKEKRVLSSAVDIKTLSDDDELKLLKDPKIVPDDYRPMVSTLVWITLLPKEDQEAILDPFTAQELSSAWIGPEDLLKKIEAVISPKKLELVKEYSKSIKPFRSSPSYRSIVKQVLKKLAQIESEKPKKDLKTKTSNKESSSNVKKLDPKKKERSKKSKDKKEAA